MNDKTPEQRKAELHAVERGSVASIYISMTKSTLEAVNQIFDSQIPKHDQAALLGSIIGEMLSCHDDELNHGDIVKQNPAAYNPMRQSFDVNYVYAYEEHRKEHNLIREGQASAAEALQKVCESHKAKKE